MIAYGCARFVSPGNDSERKPPWKGFLAAYWADPFAISKNGIVLLPMSRPRLRMDQCSLRLDRSSLRMNRSRWRADGSILKASLHIADRAVQITMLDHIQPECCNHSWHPIIYYIYIYIYIHTSHLLLEGRFIIYNLFVSYALISFDPTPSICQLSINWARVHSTEL